MQKKLVSIITPLYNGEKYVSQTIESVLAQTYPHWEMIIVNDGSKDNSEKIVEEYVKKDDRIKLFSQPNGGSASARNNGIRRAEGRYIALLDADDLWDADFLESQLNLLTENNAVVVCASYRLIDENNNEISRPHYVKPIITIPDMQKKNQIGCLTGVYDTEKYGKIYLKEELKSIRDDYAFWLDIVYLEGICYGNQKVIASYRVFSNSTTGNKKKLIKHQFLFYYEYQKLGLLKSISYTIYWGITGLKKFHRK